MKIVNSFIYLENIRLFAHHGVMGQERVVGNQFVINLRLKVDITNAVNSDEVEETVNYAEVYNAIKEEMDEPSCLLEHVVGRIVKRLFHDFPSVDSIDIKLSKRNPPMGADVDYAGVEMHCDRD